MKIFSLFFDKGLLNDTFFRYRNYWSSQKRKAPATDLDTYTPSEGIDQPEDF